VDGFVLNVIMLCQELN